MYHTLLKFKLTMLQVYRFNTTCASSKLRRVFDMADKWAFELENTKVVIAIKVDTTKSISDMMTKCQPYTVRNSLQKRMTEITKSPA